MKPSILILAAALIAVCATAQRTTRRGLHVADTADTAATAATAVCLPVDTVACPPAHSLDINGYDKPLRSRRETFFVSNNSDRATEAVAFTITYLDSKERQLHSRSVNLPLAIPPGETRQASLKSWDEQQSFYYTLSAVPSRASQATPYNVKIAVDTIFYSL